MHTPESRRENNHSHFDSLNTVERVRKGLCLGKNPVCMR